MVYSSIPGPWHHAIALKCVVRVSGLRPFPYSNSACREKVQQLVQQRLAEQFRLMGDSLGLPAAGGITLEAAAAAHDVSSGMLDADMSDDEDVEDDLAHLTPDSGTPLGEAFLR